MGIRVQQATTDETIVALASASGVSALAIVRLSGVAAHDIGRRLSRAGLPRVRRAGLRTIRSPGGEILDRAVVICYTGPWSYTGEDCVEITCHGGWVTPARIVKAAVEAGARLAEPGEFTRRAVLNGRLDLLEAEAVNDLIRAESSAAASQALRQLDGGLSGRILAIREEILRLEALVAYEIDFPEEDDGPVDPERVESATETVVESVERMLATAPIGELVRQGVVVAILGPPNVGKSSLFNALLGQRRALVTEVPGTTRDALEAVLDVMPVALRLVDTAGLRETGDVVEQLGVAVSREYLQSAHVILACGDSRETLATVAASTKRTNGRVLLVRTKSDLGNDGENAGEFDGITVSAKTGDGLESLIRRVSKIVEEDVEVRAVDSPGITHARHREILLRAREELLAFCELQRLRSVPATVSAVHLREAVRVLEGLVGLVDLDEVLGTLFGTFCVGK